MRTLLTSGLLLLAFTAFAQTNSGDYEVVHPNQRVTVSNLVPISAADATPAAVAKAAVNTALTAFNVKCGPESQLESTLDAADAPSLRALAGRISGTICMNNEKRLRVETKFIPRASIHADGLIAPLKAGKPLLIEWNHALLVLYGVVYDEHRHSDGHRDNVIRELLLIDPRRSSSPRMKTFIREKDNFAEVEGVATINVGTR